MLRCIFKFVRTLVLRRGMQHSTCSETKHPILRYNRELWFNGFNREIIPYTILAAQQASLRFPRGVPAAPKVRRTVLRCIFIFWAAESCPALAV